MTENHERAEQSSAFRLPYLTFCNVQIVPMQPMRSKSSTMVMVRSCGRKAVLRPPLRDATSHRRRRWEKLEAFEYKTNKKYK